MTRDQMRRLRVGPIAEIVPPFGKAGREILDLRQRQQRETLCGYLESAFFDKSLHPYDCTDFFGLLQDYDHAKSCFQNYSWKHDLAWS